MDFRDQLDEHYKENIKKLISYFKNKTGSIQDAEDIVHEAYFRALKYEHLFDRELNLNTWLSTIAKNVWRDMQKEKDGIVREIEEPILLNKNEVTKDMFRTALRGFNKNHKSIVNLYYRLGYSIKDISQIKMVSQSAVKIILYRFRERIKENEELYN